MYFKKNGVNDRTIFRPVTRTDDEGTFREVILTNSLLMNEAVESFFYRLVAKGLESLWLPYETLERLGLERVWRTAKTENLK